MTTDGRTEWLIRNIYLLIINISPFMAPDEEVVSFPSDSPLTNHTFTSNLGKNVLFKEKMSLPNEELIFSQMSKPWVIIRRIIGLVIVTYLLSQSILMIGAGLFLGEFEGIFLSYIGLVCSFPLLFIFFWIRRPRLIHLQLATPNEMGKTTHIMPNNETLVTPVPTIFTHHLMHDAGLLDIPPSKKLWLIFSSSMVFSILIFIALLTNQSDLTLMITLIFVVPTWLAGFSIPVFAWWSYSARTLKLPTTEFRAESALVAGMICTIPALFFNTSGNIFLSNIFGIDSPISQMILYSLIAPIGEEICKLGAIWWCREFIDSPRRGFEIGFTVGLGFAMLENLQYIALSWAGGPLSFTLTSLIRAIGSIPGHAIWTGLTGVGFAYYLLKNKKFNSEYGTNIGNKWQLIDSKTKEVIDTTIDEKKDFREQENFTPQNNPEYLQSSTNNLPSNLGVGLMLAIIGHSFWNGSSFLVDYIFTKITENVYLSVIGSLLWIIILISCLLLIGRFIIQNVILLPDKMV